MKLFVLSLALLSFFCIDALAQTSASATMSATISVPLTASTSRNMAFGTLTRGTRDSMIVAGASSDGSRTALVVFSGDESDAITLTLPASSTLATTSGTGGSMTVGLSYATRSTDATQTSSTATGSGTVSATLSSDAAGNATNNDGLGQVYVWIGGTVTPSATQQRGSYSGSISLSAAYSN